MSIENLRKEIDKIDLEILKLLNKRAKIVLEIGKIKQKTPSIVSFYSPEREKKLISKLKQHTTILPKTAIENIFTEILHASRDLQKKLKITYLGPEATFTHLAALKTFGKYAEYLPLKNTADVFIEVEKGRSDYGVVPIENSTEGVINYTLDMFIESNLLICGEVNIPIEHCLLATSTSAHIKKIYSHPQAFAQTRNWIESNFSHVELVEVSSTAEAAKMAQKDKNSAAIASEAAASIYNLKILAKNIEDIKENYTRFLIIGKSIAKKSGSDKTSIMLSIKDRVGALYDILKPFKENNINLTSIESRPTKKKAWEYVFFIDFIGHVDDKNVKKVLRRLEKLCVFVKVLGSYPKAE